MPGGSLIPVVVGGITSYIDITGLMARAAAEGAVGEANTLSNAGTGAELVKTKVGVDIPIKTLVSGSNITLTEGADTITIAAAAASGEANTSSSVGGGVSFVKAKVGVDLPFKSLLAGSGVTLTEAANTITIASSGGGSSFTGGDVPNPIKVWRTAGASTRALDTPSFRVVDTTGAAYRSFTVFADESITQHGPTPPAVQWPEYGVTTVAPASSKGPTNGVTSEGGMHRFNGPAGGDFYTLSVANAITPSSEAAFGAFPAHRRGPNQQSSIGVWGGASADNPSKGAIRINQEAVGSDGGWRWTSNMVTIPTVAGVGTCTATNGAAPANTTYTFSTGQDGNVFVGATLFFSGGAGTTIISRTSSTVWTGNWRLEAGELFAAQSFTISGSQQADSNRGSMKWGTDSAGRIFGIKSVPPADSGHATQDGDFDLLFYPSGYETDGSDLGFSSIGVRAAGRGMRFFTANTTARNTMMKLAQFGSWYDTLPNTAGTTEWFGKMKLQGGWQDERAPLRIVEQQGGGGAPAVSEMEDGDMWRIGAVLYLRTGGVTKSVTFT